MHMKALLLNGVRSPLEITERAVRKPAEDEVTVRVAGCGVCHTDIGFWQDGVPTKHALPLVLGHEISGVVAETGAAFSHLKGKEVIVPAVIPCGVCELCRGGRSNICPQQVMPGNDIDGGFADYITVPGRGLCEVSSRGDYDLSELSVVADAVTTPYQAVVRSGLRAGDVAVVVGVGGVGGYCVQVAAAMGARVIAIDVDAGRLEAIRNFGATETLDSSKLDFKTLKKRVQEIAHSLDRRLHGWKIFECSGHPAGQLTAVGLLNTAATLIVVGFTLAKIELRLSNLMALDATVQGTWGCKPELYPGALDLVISGKVHVKQFIEQFSLDAGPDALKQVAEHRLLRRAVLVPQGQ